MTQPKLICEKRTEDGKLDLSQPQPPFIYATENQICDYYFSHAPKTEENSHSVDMKTVNAWFSAQGFQFRPKTW